MRKLLVTVWLMLLLSAVGALFWYNEWRYHLPTPVPSDYKTVDRGKIINADGLPKLVSNKPLFLHFFNPDCPCSKFNITTFRSLVKQYGGQVNFAVIVMNNKKYTAREIQDKFNLDLPVLFDASIAKSCGVYSTPQAVLLDSKSRLYYRGNYNSSRYCTDEKTNYAKIAITGLLHDNNKVIFDKLALTAYGCSLPDCTK